MVGMERRRLGARRLAVGAVGLLLMSGGLAAQPAPPLKPPATAWLDVRLDARSASSGISRAESTARGSLVLRRASDTAAPIVVPIAGPGPYALEVPAGSRWTLTLTLPGFWAPPRIVAAGPPGSRTAESLGVWRLGSVHGVVRLAGDAKAKKPPPKQVVVSIVANPRPGAEIVLPDEPATCPVDLAGAFRCELPVAHLDLSISTPGFVPHYAWGVDVVAGKSVDLGTLTLRPGSSVAAWAVTEVGRIEPDRAVGQLVPLEAGSEPSPKDARVRKTTLRARLRKDGFLQLAGVAPGTYVLEVDQPGYAPARAFPIEVWPSAETVVKQPLVLRPPLRLELAIDPPLDWLGKPWHVQVDRASDFSSGWERRPAFDGVAGSDGEVRVPGQSAGTYWVEVRDSRNNAMYSDMGFKVTGAGDARRDVHINLVTVRGILRLGKEPLAATLWFGGRYASPGVEMTADEKGEFQGVLPHGGAWRLDVAARDPVLTARRHVDVEPNSAGRAEVDVDLPDTRLFGRVVDEDQQPVARARVFISTELPSSLLLTTDEHGEFDTRGLAPGPTDLKATASSPEGRRESDVRVLFIADGRETGPIELTVRRMKSLAGEVVSSQGPVAGAVVNIVPRQPDYSSFDAATTDLSGRFSGHVPSRATTALVVVEPPGNALEAFQVTTDGPPRTLTVDGAGGTLEVAFPAKLDDFTDRGLGVWVLQNGLPLPWPALVQWAAGHGERALDGRVLRIPSLAPAAYRVCFLSPTDAAEQNWTGWANPPSDCAAGSLAAGGTLRLEPEVSGG